MTVRRTSLTIIFVFKELNLDIKRTEGGGWADHVYPLISPEGTTGEWIQDPDGVLGFVPIGPGESPSCSSQTTQ
jgi:hypothetical protein